MGYGYCVTAFDPMRFRYKIALAHADVTATKLAKCIGITKSNLGAIINRGAPANHIQSIAKALGISAEWLLFGTGEQPTWFQSDQNEKQVSETSFETGKNQGKDLLLPVVGRAAAAIGANADGECDAEPPIKIKATWRAIVIHGDSGYPIVLDGQSVIVDPKKRPEKNRIVVVMTENGPELKRWGGQLEDGRVMLASLNAGRDPKLVRLADFACAPEVVVGVIFTDGVAR